MKTKSLATLMSLGLVLTANSCFAEGASARFSEVTLPANIFVNLAKKSIPSVVNISTVTTIKRTGFNPNRGNQGNPFEGDSPEDLFRGFFGQGLPQRGPVKQAALGTGFVIDPSGIILTNNHVVQGADEIKIQFTENGEPVNGKVIGRDTELDVALIQADTHQKLVALPLGDSDALQVGEYVMAVGNPYGQGHSVSHGIVSAKGRTAPGLPIANYLQIDAPINPGNSGGPLLNLTGEVVGINNAIDPRAQGIGFAIPINFVKNVLVELKQGKHIQRGFIGASIGQISPDVAERIGAPQNLRAPFVTGVSPGSPAEKAGLQPYDAIISFNHKEVHTPSDVVQAVTQMEVGTSAPMEVLREGHRETLTVKVRERPGADLASADPSTAEEKPARAGVTLEKNPNGKGVLIAQIQDGSPAAEAGLEPGDVILEIDRKSVSNPQEVKKVLSRNKSYLVRIERKENSDLSLNHKSYAIVVLDLKGAEKVNKG